MRTDRQIPPLLTAVVLAGLLAACGSSHPTATTSTARRSSSLPPAARSSSSTSTSSSAVAAGPAVTAAVFARSYARYLDGQLPASAVADVTSTGRGLLGPVIPTRDRAGVLQLVGAQPETGGLYLIGLADRAHRFQTTATIQHTTAGWLVVNLVPPDLDTILTPKPAPARAPAGSHAPTAAAAGFLDGYLPWSYAQVQLAAIKDLTPGLRAQLAANPPNVPPAFRSRHPRVLALGLQRAGPAWKAYATVSDGSVTYSLTLEVTHLHSRWVVYALVNP